MFSTNKLFLCSLTNKCNYWECKWASGTDMNLSNRAKRDYMWELCHSTQRANISRWEKKEKNADMNVGHLHFIFNTVTSCSNNQQKTSMTDWHVKTLSCCMLPPALPTASSSPVGVAWQQWPYHNQAKQSITETSGSQSAAVRETRLKGLGAGQTVTMTRDRPDRLDMVVKRKQSWLISFHPSLLRDCVCVCVGGEVGFECPKCQEVGCDVLRVSSSCPPAENQPPRLKTAKMGKAAEQ